MAYIGNNPDAIQNTIEITRFNGTGACTEFQIPQDVDDAKAIEVLVNSVQQDPDNSYTVVGGLITFTEAPSVGTNNVTVLRRTGLTYTRTQIDTSDILPNAVTTIAIANNSITSDKIAPGTVIAADIADGSVTGPKLGQTAINANNIVDSSITTVKLASGVLPATVANATTATTFTANQTFVVANVTNQLQIYGAAWQNMITLTDASTITLNLAQTQNFTVTLGGNRTVANATNIQTGQSGILVVRQDGTGSRTLSFGTGWRFPSNTAPTLTTTGSAVDVIVFAARDSGNLVAQAILNVT